MNPADDNDVLQIGPDPDKLEVYNRQQLSAMLDGELSPDQARFMRRRLQHDAELSMAFERWQVCGDVLRGRQVSLLPTDFADRVQRGIEAGDSVAVVTADVARRPRLLRWGGGAALAASVALVALFVGRLSGPDVMEADSESPALATSISADNRAGAGSRTATDDVLADAGPGFAQGVQADAPPADAAAALAAAGAAVAVAEVPRRAGERRNVRSQSQRAALRAQQGSGTRAVAAASPRPASSAQPLNVRSDGPAPTRLAVQNAPLVLPAASLEARPWPRATMSGLSGASGFSVRYSEPFPAPSWAGSQPGSGVLPSFPVGPDEAGRDVPARQSRAMP